MLIELRPNGGASSKGLRERLEEDAPRYGRPLKSPAFWTMAVYHFGRWSREQRSPLISRIGAKIYGGLFLAIELLTLNTINREAEIGEDFTLLHGGSVRIHPDTKIGDRVTIMHEVTLGTNSVSLDDEGVPTIGDDVFIGCGAKVLGPIHIGDGAHIGANSLVVTDVPAGATACGVPARILRNHGIGKLGPRHQPSTPAHNDDHHDPESPVGHAS